MKRTAVLFPSRSCSWILGVAEEPSPRRATRSGSQEVPPFPPANSATAPQRATPVTVFLALGVPDFHSASGSMASTTGSPSRNVTPAGGGTATRDPTSGSWECWEVSIYSFPGTTAKPYLITGGGIYNTKPDIAGAKSKNDFGFNAGFGVDLRSARTRRHSSKPDTTASRETRQTAATFSSCRSRSE